MKFRLVLTTVLLLVFFSPLALASDADSAVAPTVDFGTKINEAVTNLVTGVTAPVMPFGWTLLALFGAYAILQTLLSSTTRSLAYHHFVPAATILAVVAVLFRVLVAALMLAAYTQFHRIFPALANGLTQTVSTAELKEVFAFLNDISNKMPPVGPLEVMPGLIAVVLLGFAALSSFALTLMTATSHAIVGVLSIVGPLMIPFYVLPGHDKRFWSWVDNMVLYSMYRFIAACFAMLWAHVYLALFASIKVFSVGSWVVAIPTFILITLSCVFVAFKIPEVSHMIFGGVGFIANGISHTAQSLVLRGVARVLK
jgi:hypothetical protein